MRAGARGYLLKGAEGDDILRAVRTVGDGEAIFGPSIARRLIQFFSAPQTPQPPQVFPDPTGREREVLDRIARGESNTEIARHLGVTQKTARNYVSNIFSKLQVADQAQAIVQARQAGLGRDAPWSACAGSLSKRTKVGHECSLQNLRMRSGDVHGTLSIWIGAAPEQVFHLLTAYQSRTASPWPSVEHVEVTVCVAAVLPLLVKDHVQAR